MTLEELLATEVPQTDNTPQEFRLVAHRASGVIHVFIHPSGRPRGQEGAHGAYTVSGNMVTEG